MKTKTIRGLLFLLALCTVLCAAGCSKSEDSSQMAGFDGGYNYDTGYSTNGSAALGDSVKPSSSASSDWESMKESAPTENTGGTEKPSEPKDSTRKLIKYVTMRLETKEFDSFRGALEEQIALSGGYVESSSVEGGGYSGSGNRYATWTVRVPAEELENFCSGISSVSNVVSRTERTEDVTLSYYDMESHMKALRSEYDTLVGILEKCTELSDVISVQSRITEVLYQIEAYKTQLNNYDSLVSYSTVTLRVQEVDRVTVVEKQTVGQRIEDGFSRTLEDLTVSAQDFTVWFVVNLPYLLIWAVVILAAALIVRTFVRRLRTTAKNRKSDGTAK